MLFLTELFDKICGIADIRVFSPDGVDKTAAMADKLAHCIKFSRLYVKNGELFVTVKRHDTGLVCKIAGDLGLSAEITAKHGTGYIAEKYRKRIGILIGALLSAAMLFFLSNTVLRIEVTGNADVPDSEIIRYLEEAGITYGSFIPSLDLRAAENKLAAASPKFASAAIRSSGFRIIAEVTKAAQIPRLQAKEQPCNIISLYDAQITSVTVYRGMLMPMKGDTVRKGEILISGIVSKKFEGTYNVRAMGDIKGRYRRTAEFTQNFSDTVRKYGTPFTNKYLTVFDSTFSLGGNSKLPEKYEFDKSREHIEFLIFTLPASVTRLDVYPYEETEVLYTEEEAKVILEKRARDFENDILKDNGTEIIDKELKYKVTENGVTLTAEYIAEGSIGIEKPIFTDK